MLTKEQFQPNKNECQELRNIRDLLTSTDYESKKLGKIAFFTSNYYKRIRHKNLRIICNLKDSLTLPVYIELNKKLEIDILVAFINYLLKVSNNIIRRNLDYSCYGVCYIYYI